jgi:hypothetical protein
MTTKRAHILTYTKYPSGGGGQVTCVIHPAHGDFFHHGTITIATTGGKGTCRPNDSQPSFDLRLASDAKVQPGKFMDIVYEGPGVNGNFMVTDVLFPVVSNQLLSWDLSMPYVSGQLRLTRGEQDVATGRSAPPQFSLEGKFILFGSIEVTVGPVTPPEPREFDELSQPDLAPSPNGHTLAHA